MNTLLASCGIGRIAACLLLLALSVPADLYAQCCGRQPAAPKRGGGFLPGEIGVPNPELLLQFSTNGVTKEKVESLLDRYRKVFPKIAFSQEWEDRTVNAIAFGHTDGQRHVVIFGGMLRHPSMGLEGINIVLAHEVGHHYGNTDKCITNPTTDSNQRIYDEGAYCEGQADFWATRTGLRLLCNYANPIEYNETSITSFDWASFDNMADTTEYTNVVAEGIKQTHALLTGGLFHNYDSFIAGQAASGTGEHGTPDPRRYADAANCGHTPAICRKVTYQAGSAKSVRPDCASFSSFSQLFLPTTIDTYKPRDQRPLNFSTPSGNLGELLKEMQSQNKAIQSELKALRKELEDSKSKK